MNQLHRQRLSQLLMPSLMVVLLSAGCAPGLEDRSQSSASLSSGSVELSDNKVAVVDLLAVLERTKIGKEMLATVKVLIDQQVQQLTGEQQKVLSQLDAKPSDAQREFLMMQYQQIRQRIQAAAVSYSLKRVGVLNKISSRVEAIVKPIAERDGWSAVMVKGRPETTMTTYYSADNLDLTDIVIEELDRQSP